MLKNKHVLFIYNKQSDRYRNVININFKNMELLEYHFSNISGNLHHDVQTDVYEMFGSGGAKTFKLFNI
jgi:hypothetical protein